MSDYLDEIFDSSGTIRDCSYDLSSLAKCFLRTGNREVYDELMEVSRAIYDAQEKIGRAVSLELNRSLGESRKRVGETLSLVLNANQMD